VKQITNFAGSAEIVEQRMPQSSQLPAIRIVSQVFYPSNQAMAIRVRHLADALIKAGYETSVLTSRLPGDTGRYQVKRLASPISTHRDGVYLRLFKELLASLEIFIRVLFGPKRLYLISSPPFTMTSAAAMACRWRGLDYVFDVRDEYPDVYFSEGLASEQSTIGRMLRRIERANYRGAMMVSTVTDRIVDKIKERIPENQDKVTLVRNGFAPSIPWVSDVRKDPVTLLFHGNMGKFQAPEVLIQVAEKCQAMQLKVQFEVYGWGAQIDTIKSAAERLNNLYYQGEIDHSDVPAIISKTTIGISFQGNNEISQNSFPSKVMEFIGSGIPTLVTPISEGGRFVEQHNIGKQFDPSDIDGIVQAIQAFIQGDSIESMREKMLPLRESLSRSSISDEFVRALSDQLQSSSRS